MLRAILNKFRRQHRTKQQLYGRLPPIVKAIKIRRTRHAGHSWRSRDELVSDVLLWTPSHVRAKAVWYSHEQLYIHICMQKHNDDTIKTSGHSSLEKYTSHFIEIFVCERELETEQRHQYIDPHSSGYNSISFPFSWAAQPGAWRPSLY